MAITPHIIINNVSFLLEHTSIQFTKLNLSFDQLKYGIVGANGVGKSTFLKLLYGTVLPDQGSIQRHGSISLAPQSHVNFAKTITIQDVLAVTDILAALNRVNSGYYNEHDFDTLQNQWNIEARIETVLRTFKLWPIDLKQPFATLSGGQKTKVLLIKTLLSQANFILLDEPTNNLDQSSRETLYHHIETSKNGFVIVSHDRDLLNKMDYIIEITAKNIAIYGGNYDAYHTQKKVEINASQQDYHEAKRALKKAHRSVQKSKEKHKKHQTKGKQLRKSGSQTKIILDSMKSRSEKTQARMSIKDECLLKQAQSRLLHTKEKMEVDDEYHINLDTTKVPQNKVVLTIESIDFKYPTQSHLMFKQFKLNIMGPERVALTGANGCGKSTLIKLIRKQLKPLHGAIQLGVEHMTYLDQEVAFLTPDATLLDHFLTLNPNTTLFDAYSALAKFHFRNKDARKKVAALSGGERLRAGLAISLMAKHPPQLIILDEPTNHLDLITITAIERMLMLYQGAILAVSHDKHFLKHIGISKTIHLEYS